jgi:hypothetical protein
MQNIDQNIDSIISSNNKLGKTDFTEQFDTATLNLTPDTKKNWHRFYI